MNVLFVGYWGMNEGLSVATIDPHLETLSRFPEVDTIIYTSIERSREPLRRLNIAKVQHVPLYSGLSLTNKLRDYTRLPGRLAKLCRQYKINLIICRGAPAGALGYLVCKRTKIPFCVESFEPHADYMRESGVWSKRSPHYQLSKYWEKKQKEQAKLLIPVAHNYAQQLTGEEVEESRVTVVPCTVDVGQFRFSAEQREELRNKLNIERDAVTGIYVGKYGGIYMDEEAFRLYQAAFRHWTNFHLIILSPKEHHRFIYQRIEEFSLPKAKITVREVPHQKVAKYLSTADFAFATYKPGKSKAFLSPIKIGEYWANGLPVVLTKGVGDDAAIVVNEQAGVLIRRSTSGSLTVDYGIIQELISRKDYRSNIQQIAKKYRGRDMIRQGYLCLIGEQ